MKFFGYVVASILVICIEGSAKIKCAVNITSNQYRYFFINDDICNYGCHTSTVIQSSQATYKLLTSPITIYKIVAGSGVRNLDYYKSEASFNKSVENYNDNADYNFKSCLLQSWSSLRPRNINVTLQGVDHKTVAWLLFNVQSSDTITSWFNIGNLVGSYPWSIDLLKNNVYNDFSITGTTSWDTLRTFIITNKYGGCEIDEGVLAVFETPDLCFYVAGTPRASFQTPIIIYTVKDKNGANISKYGQNATSLELNAIYSQKLFIKV